MPHNELTELEAWLYFLSSDKPLHIQRIIEKYPFFRELYQDIIEFRYYPKELISMFSESLLIADRNTVKLMIDELRDELTLIQAEISKKNATLLEKDASLAEKDASLAEKDASLAEKDASLAEKDALIQKLQRQLAETGK